MTPLTQELRGRIPGRDGLFDVRVTGDTISSITFHSSTDRTEGHWILPGFFDLQVNGFLGHSFGDPGLTEAQAAAADQGLRDRGVTAYLPTIITSSAADTAGAVARLQQFKKAGALPASCGLHLEGPWISPVDGYRGVHQLAHFRRPDNDELARLQELAQGSLVLLTVAPEVEGALELIRMARSLGITVSLGHTAAGYDAVARAVDAGATLSTHLFNGCAQTIDRHENPILAQLAQDGLAACFIADGHHVPLPALKVALRAKGLERSVLVSDIAPLSGLPDGEYTMEAKPVVMANGGIRVKNSSLLSGAARTLNEDVALLGRQAWPGIEEAMLLASQQPAWAVGRGDWAELSPGRKGPVGLFHWDGNELTLRARAGF